MLCVVGRICVVLAGVFFTAVNLDAASVIYQFEPISTSLLPSSPDPQVQAIFEDEKPGTVRLTITSDLPSGEFLGNLYFNFDPMDNVNRLHFAPLGARNQPLPKISTGANSFKADGGYYDICFAFGTTGKNRFSGDDSITYLITEPGLNASDFVFVDSTGSRGGANGMYYASASIQGNCGGSQWLAAGATSLQPVPEPASLALLASAGGLGWCACSRSSTRRLIKNWFGPRKVS
jgi:hypothetical protein